MFHVVTPAGTVIGEFPTREIAEALKRSYDAHPVNHGRRVARIVEPDRDH